MSSLFTDKQLAVQPGQSSTEGILAGLHLQAYHQAHEQLDKLPAMLEQQKISLHTYQETDRSLCALIDSYAYFLGVLGFPQPPRPR